MRRINGADHAALYRKVHAFGFGNGAKLPRAINQAFEYLWRSVLGMRQPGSVLVHTSWPKISVRAPKSSTEPDHLFDECNNGKSLGIVVRAKAVAIVASRAAPPIRYC